MINEISLPVLKVFIKSRISGDLLKSFATPAEVTVLLDRVLRDLTFQVTQKVASYPIRVERVVYPTDWWQAFKEAWFPLWALNRWPVQYVRVEIRADAVFPDIPIPASCGRSVTVLDRRAWGDR